MYDVTEINTQNTMLKKFIKVLVGIIALTLLAMFGVSLAAGYALKDTQLGAAEMPGSVPMVSRDGTPISVDVSEASGRLFELPAQSTLLLSGLTHITAFVDMSSAPVGAWVEYTTGVASAYKKDDVVAYVETTAGHLITIDGATETATLSMNGNTYTVANELPAGARRQLEEKAGDESVHPRRRARRGAFLTSGGFSFKVASSNRGGNT